jgi:hypothetical protein
MRNTAFIIVVLVGFFVNPGCNNNAEKQVSEKDTIRNAKKLPTPDSTDYEGCYEEFFKRLPRFSDSGSAYLVWKNGKRKSLTQFFKDEFMSPVSQYGKKDLDGDGISELIIFNYTGGAHCCDEYYFFRQKSGQDFEFKAHLMGGQACIDAASNLITYSFSELLGYFYSCYACSFNDSSGNFKTMREIQLKYTGPKLEIVPYDKNAEQQNLKNLDVLQKNGFEKIEETMDNGWRKEIAMNLAIWHFNHNKNWKQTKLLFNKYYKFPDASKVWKEFHRTLAESEKENSF